MVSLLWIWMVVVRVENIRGEVAIVIIIEANRNNNNKTINVYTVKVYHNIINIHLSYSNIKTTTISYKITKTRTTTNHNNNNNNNNNNNPHHPHHHNYHNYRTVNHPHSATTLRIKYSTNT